MMRNYEREIVRWGGHVSSFTLIGRSDRFHNCLKKLFLVFDLLSVGVYDEITSKNTVIPVLLPLKGAENTLNLTQCTLHWSLVFCSFLWLWSWSWPVMISIGCWTVNIDCLFHDDIFELGRSEATLIATLLWLTIVLLFCLFFFLLLLFVVAGRFSSWL